MGLILLKISTLTWDGFVFFMSSSSSPCEGEERGEGGSQGLYTSGMERKMVCGF
jgi:hypothetical protein